MPTWLKKLAPPFVLDLYHRTLALAAAARYGHPSEKMIGIGVTGTNGKSTVCAMIARVLEEAGRRVGMTSTVTFKIAGEERLNDKKMTMLGRFALQKMLAQMAAAGCEYAVIETSSEGIKQHRHAGINYDVAVFTNLTPEHLESHGGFEQYKRAKGELFAKLGRDPVKRLRGGPVPKTSVANLDSADAAYFLGFPANKKYGFLVEKTPGAAIPDVSPLVVVKATDVATRPDGSAFAVHGVPFVLSVPGIFNVENALAAVSVGLSQGIDLPTMAAALRKFGGAPGRLEFIDEGQPFTAIVDYAPEPESFRKLYDVVAMIPKARVIHVLGSAGGGRDRDRRPILGALAANSADVVIVTNEDPYDDDPAEIIEQVAAGARRAGKKDGVDLFAILDRGAAIAKAVALARPGDLVLLTGKGAEQAICVAHGGKIPWDDRTKLRAALKKRL